jgi:hypothetical protein
MWDVAIVHDFETNKSGRVIRPLVHAYINYFISPHCLG